LRASLSNRRGFLNIAVIRKWQYVLLDWVRETNRRTEIQGYFLIMAACFGMRIAEGQKSRADNLVVPLFAELVWT
jgi:hypothetical protein